MTRSTILLAALLPLAVTPALAQEKKQGGDTLRAEVKRYEERIERLEKLVRAGGEKKAQAVAAERRREEAARIARLDQERSRFASSMEKMRGELAAAKSREAKSTSALRTTSSQVEQLRNQLAAAEAKLTEQLGRGARRDQDLAKLGRAFSGNEHKRADLQRQAAAASARIRKMEVQLATSQQAAEKYASALTESQRRSELQGRQQKEQTAQIAALNRQIVALSTANRDLRTRNTKLQQDGHRLATSAETYRKRAEEHAANLSRTAARKAEAAAKAEKELAAQRKAHPIGAARADGATRHIHVHNEAGTVIIQGDTGTPIPVAEKLAAVPEKTADRRATELRRLQEFAQRQGRIIQDLRSQLEASRRSAERAKRAANLRAAEAAHAAAKAKKEAQAKKKAETPRRKRINLED